MNVRWLLNASIIMGVLAGSTLADAACRERLDWYEARGRNAWAEKWGYLMPGEAADLDSKGQYVEFTTACYRLNATNTLCSPALPVSFSGAYMGGLTVADTCNSYDCLAPEQTVSSRGELLEIGELAGTEAKTITALRSGSSVDVPQYSEQPVASFPETPIETEMLVFTGEGNERIQVTGPHPMVLADGTLVRASNVREGDELAGVNGKPIRISSVETYPFTGSVYNVELTTTDKTENIIVAGDFLVGTALFQKEWSHQTFRLMMRDHVEADAIRSEL